MYLICDTETSGMIKQFGLPSSEVDNFPRVVQFAWAILDQNYNSSEIYSYLIKPDGWEIHPKAEEVHGISADFATEHGHHIIDVLRHFLDDLGRCEYVVCHNASFDIPIIGAEFIRLNQIDPLLGKSIMCTMKSSTQYCGIKKFNSSGFKWPRLHELHEKLFGTSFSNAHDAGGDVKATVNCFRRLRELKVM